VTSPAHAFWFGEDQARFIVTVAQGEADAIISKARATGVTLRRLGQAGGDTLTLPGERPILVKILVELFESWLPDFMARQAS
jgi:phosphoribosylformylglycinamidine synthase